jgi:hypothetical protein
MTQLDSVTEASEGFRGRRNRCGVTVESEHRDMSELTEDGRRVTPAPDCGVDHRARGHRPEEIHDLPDHDWSMLEASHESVHSLSILRGSLIGSPPVSGRSPGCLPD